MRDFRKKIQESVATKKALLGTFLQLPSPEIAEIYGYCGYDFVIIDNEHSVIGPEMSLRMTRAAEAAGTFAMIRTPDVSETNIKKALDTGASGVLIPGIQSAQDVRDVIRFAKYSPMGMRGSCPGVRANCYGKGDLSYYQQANKEVAVLVQIEGRQACEEIDEILEIEGLDGVLLGPVDLSMSLGHGGDVDHPEVVEIMDRIFEKAKARKMAVAAFAMSPETGRRWIDKGLDLLAYHIDGMMIRECAAAGKQALGR